MRPLRPLSTTRSVGRVTRRTSSLERRDVKGTAVAEWVEITDFDNGWSATGSGYEPPAYKESPNAGKAPFLRGSVSGGTSGTQPFADPLPGGPFDGTTVYFSALTDGTGFLFTTIDTSGVVTVFSLAFATSEDLDTLTTSLAAHLADSAGAHAASAISVLDTGGNFTGTTVEAVLAELAGMSGGVPTSRTITAGSGLTGGGNLTADRTIDLNVDNSTLEVSSDVARVKDGGITSAKIADGTITTTDLAFDVATQAELDAHTSDPTAAHAASAISFTPGGTLSSTTVQNAIEELLAEGGGGGGSGTPADIQVFNAGLSQTWTKPGGAPTSVEVIVVGPGGGGGGGPSSVNTAKSGGSGGGAGISKRATFRASVLAGTVNVDVGAGGTAGTGGAAGAGANGGNGGDGSAVTKFGTHLTAFFGGGGRGGISGSSATGGAGASQMASAANIGGGAPSSSGSPIGGQGSSTSAGIAGTNAETGGASGGGSTTSTPHAGGSSVFGGAGGGSGGSVSGANVGTAGEDGGTSNSYTAGGGAAKGTGGATPTAGADGVFAGPYCGQGGGGGGAGSAAGGAHGGAGFLGSGGGGGGGSSSATSSLIGGAGGAGGDGICIVITYY